VLTTALTGPVVPPGSPVAGGGGPDAYGYRYLDSDTTCPGAPVYSWVSIRDIGTPITGLGDDNVAGPFQIGFAFPYYWYTVNSVYVGSNGYITFGDNFLSAHPFQNMPATARPNNTLAAFMSDLDFSHRPSVCKAWYWSNSRDTFIVEYDSIEFWASGGSSGCNTFQIILTRADSSILYQYKEQVGAPNGQNPGWIPDNFTAGIENITGAMGLSYLYGNIPSGNMIHTNLAVRFFPPESTTAQIHDYATWLVQNDANRGFFVVKGTPTNFTAQVKNTGNQAETGAPVVCLLKNASNAIKFADTVQVGALAPGQVFDVTFPRTCTSTNTNGTYRLIVQTSLTGDMFRKNDTVTVEVRIINDSAELAYDNNPNGAGTAWNGNMGGMGNRFIAPRYPATILGLRANLNYQTAACGCTLRLYREGPGGGPGEILEGSVINVSSGTPSWYNYMFTTPVVIDSGPFFVGVTSNASSDPVYNIDTLKPVSQQAWEFTGVWAPSRWAAQQDVCIRAIGTFRLTGAGEQPGAEGVYEFSAAPNPTPGRTQIRFGRNLTTANKVLVYNNAGELVRTIPALGQSVTWDGRDYAGHTATAGIYFARLMTDRTPIKIVLAR
jgi:hypothetical protein